MKQINEQLSLPQPDQRAAQQLDLATFIPDEDTSITVDLTLDLGSAGGDKVVRRGVKMGASDFSGAVSDLTAEVDFEIGPDVSSESARPSAVVHHLVYVCALHCITITFLHSGLHKIPVITWSQIFYGPWHITCFGLCKHASGLYRRRS